MFAASSANEIIVTLAMIVTMSMAGDRVYSWWSLRRQSQTICNGKPEVISVLVMTVAVTARWAAKKPGGGSYRGLTGEKGVIYSS